MNTNDQAQAEYDAKIAMESMAKGQPIPLDVAHRIQERAAKASRELLKTHGMQNSGVQIIREIRGELPNP